MSSFLSTVAVILSAIALGGAGLALTQTFQLQQSFRELNASMQNSPVASESPQLPPQSPQADSLPTVRINEPSQQVNTEIQPGQFVEFAFKDRAEVELLSVKRLQNPDDGKRNIVNIQMRVRNLSGSGGNVIVTDQTIARNPETSERYESYERVVDKAERERSQRDGTDIDRSNRIQRSTGAVSMGLIKPRASVDAYVWMSIPEGIQTIDLFVPKTAVFLKVPISD